MRPLIMFRTSYFRPAQCPHNHMHKFRPAYINMSLVYESVYIYLVNFLWRGIMKVVSFCFRASDISYHYKATSEKIYVVNN